jgi:hypothetical protein
MKHALRVILLAVSMVLITALPALAADPTPGVYNSTDLGGSVLLGRGTQSWVAPLNANQGLNDIFNSRSWDGATLGTQWTLSCGIQPAVQTVVDNRDGSGNGTVVFTNVFQSGTFFLSKDGPWGDAVNDLTGTINITTSIVTVVYVSNVPVQSRLNIDSSGQFDGSDCLLRFVVANGIGGGDTDLLPKPAGYPTFLAPDCSASRVFGSWGDINQVTLQLDCPVPTHESTWGTIKTLYR